MNAYRIDEAADLDWAQAVRARAPSSHR
jgi:hypothetical protein